MATSQRLSRGFHRLALFLAAIPLLVGVGISLFWSNNLAHDAWRAHDQLVCANHYLLSLDASAASEQEGTCTDENYAGQKRKWDEAGQQHEGFFTWCAAQKPKPSWLLLGPSGNTINLKQIGCSDWEYDNVSLGEARAAPAGFSWAFEFFSKLGIGLAITLALSLALYGLVRAIGWVIGGFAAS